MSAGNSRRTLFSLIISESGGVGLVALAASLKRIPISPSKLLRKARPSPAAAAAAGVPSVAAAPEGASFLPQAPSEKTITTAAHARVRNVLIRTLYLICYRLDIHDRRR